MAETQIARHIAFQVRAAAIVANDWQQCTTDRQWWRRRRSYASCLNWNVRTL